MQGLPAAAPPRVRMRSSILLDDRAGLWSQVMQPQPLLHSLCMRVCRQKSLVSQPGCCVATTTTTTTDN